MRRLRPSAAILLVSLAAIALPAAPAAARPRTHHVTVTSNYFFPATLHVSVGDTVVWTPVEVDHSVTSEDKTFDYFPHRQLGRGEAVSFTFLRDGVVKYYCRKHGQFGGPKEGSFNMLGSVVVGRAQAPSPPGPPEVRDVPAEYPTIRAALAGAAPGSEIRVAPGVYGDVPSPRSLGEASVVVDVPGVTLTGAGAHATVIEGHGDRPAGIVVLADDVVVRNLSVRGHRGEAVAVRSARRVVVSDVATTGGTWGVLASDADGLTIAGVDARDAFGGVMISRSSAASVRASVSRATFGVALDGVTSSRVSGSVMRQTTTGIAVRSLAGAPPVRSAGVIVEGNDIADGVDRASARLPEIAPFAGIWVAGAEDVRVASNTIAGHAYGVLVAAGEGVVSTDARIAGNALASSVDVAYDGLGVGVCFERNHRAGGAPTASPASAQETYACDGGLAAGVPNPEIILAMAARYAAAL